MEESQEEKARGRAAYMKMSDAWGPTMLSRNRIFTRSKVRSSPTRITAEQRSSIRPIGAGQPYIPFISGFMKAFLMKKLK
jgi:hypothetical protein